MRIAWLNWRDTANPEGGGSEVYLERIARGLVERGHQVSIVCAAHDRAPARESVDGVDFWRQGSKLGVYGQARRLLRSGALGPLDVVIDTQNGIPFFSSWATKAPVVVLVHHVHREQWPVVYDPVRARAGWILESRVAPRVYRRHRYIAVSQRTRDELIGLGIDEERINVVHNGTEPLPHDGPISDLAISLSAGRSPEPSIVVLGRLVPHKRVEHALEAAAVLLRELPRLRVTVVGDGWWSAELHAHAQRLGIADSIEFTGFVDETTKDEILRRAWVLALPSLKEGWGLVVMEAAARAVPTIAYADAGGVAESVRSGETGILVDSAAGVAGFTEALRAVLVDSDLRTRLGSAALAHSGDFHWEASVEAFERVLHSTTQATPRTSVRVMGA